VHCPMMADRHCAPTAGPCGGDGVRVVCEVRAEAKETAVDIRMI
jgi:hypothetical protein